MKQKLLFSYLALVFSSGSYASELKAIFSSPAANQTVVLCDFDSETSLDSWSLQSLSPSYTWQISDYYPSTLPNFSDINPSSVSSLYIPYSYGSQDEVLTSPKYTIEPNSSLSFYTAFNGVWVMDANFKIYVNTVGEDSQEELFDAFMWAQESGHDDTKWLPFTFDLSPWEGKDIQFVLEYKGAYGDDVYVDDFKVEVAGVGDDAHVNAEINTPVQFNCLTPEEGLTYAWTFEEGTPSTSTEKNPVVTFDSYGSFDVSLTVSDGTNSDTQTRDDFVSIKGVGPTSDIGMPTEGYSCPYMGTYIPTGTPVQFRDLSKGNPTSWDWIFTGTEEETSNEQNPIMTFPEAGYHSVGLKASNDFGSDRSQYDHAIQVGGSANVWNIDFTEDATPEVLSLGWYGYYGGTNWLAMTSFGEYFKKPVVAVSLDSVYLYFGSTDVATKDAILKVDIMSVGDDNMPSEVLASTDLKVTDLVDPADEYRPTKVGFAEPLILDEPFFVTISNIPNSETESGSDNIALYTHRRDIGELCTAYHLVDDDIYPEDNGWYENSDDPLSLCIAPKLTYVNDEESVENIKDKGNSAIAIVVDDEIQILPEYMDGRIVIYDMNGRQVVCTIDANKESSYKLGEGVFIIRHMVSGDYQKVVIY